MAKTHDSHTVIDRLERQLTLFTRLEGLAERQSALIGDGRTPELLAIIAERQTVIDEIVKLARLIEHQLAGAPPDACVNRLLDQIGALAARVKQRDETDHRRLEIDRDRLAGEMAGVGRGRTAVAAYSTRPRENRARFKDMEA